MPCSTFFVSTLENINKTSLFVNLIQKSCIDHLFQFILAYWELILNEILENFNNLILIENTTIISVVLFEKSDVISVIKGLFASRFFLNNDIQEIETFVFIQVTTVIIIKINPDFVNHVYDNFFNLFFAA